MNTQNTAAKQKVMLAMLNISLWHARAFDNRATAKVEDSYENKKIGRFNKDLMPEKPVSFDRITKAATALRALFSTYTLEYQQLGVRLMTTAIYLDWTAKLREAERNFNGLLDDFVAEYPAIIQSSKIRLGPLFNDEDYPHINDIRAKFEIRFSVLPFPDAEHFGVDLPEADLLAVKADIDRNMQESVDLVYNDLSARLYEATLKLAQRTSSDSKFHSSAIQNLRDIIEILPKLNFTNDARLTQLANQASRELTVFNADALRTSPIIRADVASRATAIAYDMSQYMGFSFDNSLLDDEPVQGTQLNLLAA